MSTKIGFIGAGQMATALAGGFLRKGLVNETDLFAYDISEAASSNFSSLVGAKIFPSLAELVADTDLIFLAVKPQQVESVLKELRGIFDTQSPKTLVSIVAGVTIGKYREILGANASVIRVMPNTPCLVGCGVCGWTPSENVSGKDVEFVQTLLDTVGISVQVPEKQLDAITGLSGSGPAFGYLILEALSDGGVRMGLSRDMSTRLAAQTLKGAAEMVLKTGEHPGVLKDRVTSPGGTTIAGLVAMEKSGIRSGMISAVIAATERAEELKGQ